MLGTSDRCHALRAGFPLPRCGSGGMLTEAQNYIKDSVGPIAARGDVYLYGKEINDETYAICKSDMMIKGNNP